MKLQYLRYRHRHKSNHLRTLDSDSVSISEVKEGCLREGTEIMAPVECVKDVGVGGKVTEVGCGQKRAAAGSGHGKAHGPPSLTSWQNFMKTAGFTQGQLDIESVQLVIFLCFQYLKLLNANYISLSTPLYALKRSGLGDSLIPQCHPHIKHSETDK